MPLYKMTEKRLAKRAKEDEEGMTELKAVIGPESGSEESVSEGSSSGSAEEGEEGQMDSEDDSSSDDDNEDEQDETAKAGEKRKRLAADDGELNEDDTPFPVTIDTALSSPIYDLPPTPTGKINQACVLCPGKKMKTDVMVKKHLDSGSHLRATKRWNRRMKVVAKKPLTSDDPREVVKELLQKVEDQKNVLLRVRARAGKGKKLPPDHPGYAPIAPEVTVAKVRRREEKFARRAKRKGEKAAKKARLLAALPPGYMEAKAAKREDARRKRKEKTREMRALGFEREGKGRSPRTVRKEKIALKLLSEAGGGVAVGTGANMGEVGLNRMAKRMVGRGRGKV